MKSDIISISREQDNLNKILSETQKTAEYAGLDGTELAISESQERMAIVVAAKDVDAMLAFAAEENPGLMKTLNEFQAYKPQKDIITVVKFTDTLVGVPAAGVIIFGGVMIGNFLMNVSNSMQEEAQAKIFNRIQGEVIKRLQAENVYLRERLYSDYRHERLVWQHEQHFLRKFFNDFERTLLGLVKNVPSYTSTNYDVQLCLNLLNRFKQETV